jgi:hypothetical protein
MYKNFSLAIYCTAPFLNRVSLRELEEDFAFFEEYLKVNKVYLETHRGKDDVPKEKMLEIIEFFNKKGVITSGGITTTIDLPGDLVHNLRIFHTFCYSNEILKNRLKEIVEYTASLFDEVILDDFYFTSCSCPECIERKGNLSWKEYRLKLMTEISQNYVVGPAKKVNPKVNMIIKYPNWIDSYHQNGYNPETQKDIFDELYTGTETRDPKYTQQHLPRYLSYYLMRWFENVKPGKNKGGWFDSFECNLNQYIEQAHFTLFSKAKEITLFDFNSLRRSTFIPALSLELEKLDEYLSELGNPIGVKVYHPFHSDGENHLSSYLGMIGIPFDPTPYFPNDADIIFLAENSAEDKEILNKLKGFLLKGGDVIITSGFLRRMGKNMEEFTSIRYTDKKVLLNLFAIDPAMSGFSKYVYSRKEIIFPVIEYHTNSSWPIIVGINGENNFPILLRDFYGKGRIYVLNIPDNYSDIYLLPIEILNEIRKTFLNKIGIYLQGDEKICMFLYDNDLCILESLLPYRTNVTLKTKEKEINIRLEPNSYKVIKI